MKRAALLLLFAGVPLLLALVPRLRRALVRRVRLLLLLYVGAILLTAFATGFWSSRLSSLSGGEIALALAGMALVLLAFGAVLRDTLNDRAPRG
ncbi:MAG TPA: hypothetical protein VL084_15950 [Thermoanaerobaculia bacterium]|nr:hypothetical protein [Thermoanaerobaculia bacterium]